VGIETKRVEDARDITSTSWICIDRPRRLVTIERLIPGSAEGGFLFPYCVIGMSKFTFQLNCLTKAGDAERLFSFKRRRYPEPMIPTLGVVLDFDILKR
jgi:hypothetical protein